jgi:hypothetical protein
MLLQMRNEGCSWEDTYAPVKHVKEVVTLFTCSQSEHTGYKYVWLGSTMVKAPSHVCPMC